MSVRKRFDRDLYNETDKLAKQTIIDLLKFSTYQITENPKKTQVDLLVYDGQDHILNIECEIKRVWKDKEFKYESVQFPERKAKYAKLDKKTLFVMLNADQTAYLTVKGEDLLASPLVEVPNKYNWKGELFYQVPLSKVVFNDMEKSVKEILK